MCPLTLWKMPRASRKVAKPDIVLKVTYIFLMSVHGSRGFLDLPCWRGGQIPRIHGGRIYEVGRHRPLLGKVVFLHSYSILL